MKSKLLLRVNGLVKNWIYEKFINLNKVAAESPITLL